ncbi:hypothetical protein BKA82DRAFT_20660 [Pisolithus tinctorius]|uniref:Uncharacterized protein n=1 Tax=Pisolithus tinctorius Marx 270 TaxID=870435 RepID=A0A0C3KNI0_PISTI|nr:hypothetical protein BKA82DRAFT_20660 [Pisolithus tinctorius]KIO11162.1 hypothetical protein M404DRAFT_20660 [Pisolithus tinctorius Marx 270]
MSWDVPRIMHNDKLNCYLMDEELGAILPSTGYVIVALLPGLAFFKPEDAQYFVKILKEKDEMQLSVYKMKECKIIRLLLKIKNSTLPVRKTAICQIMDKAHEFCAGAYVGGSGVASFCQSH